MILPLVPRISCAGLRYHMAIPSEQNTPIPPPPSGRSDRKGVMTSTVNRAASMCTWTLCNDCQTFARLTHQIMAHIFMHIRIPPPPLVPQSNPPIRYRRSERPAHSSRNPIFAWTFVDVPGRQQTGYIEIRTINAETETALGTLV